MEEIFFKIAAFIILALFYGCYMIKMILQRRKGIQTDQIGKGKTSGTHSDFQGFNGRTRIKPAIKEEFSMDGFLFLRDIKISDRM